MQAARVTPCSSFPTGLSSVTLLAPTNSSSAAMVRQVSRTLIGVATKPGWVVPTRPAALSCVCLSGLLYPPFPMCLLQRTRPLGLQRARRPPRLPRPRKVRRRASRVLPIRCDRRPSHSSARALPFIELPLSRRSFFIPLSTSSRVALPSCSHTVISPACRAHQPTDQYPPFLYAAPAYSLRHFCLAPLAPPFGDLPTVRTLFFPEFIGSARCRSRVRLMCRRSEHRSTYIMLVRLLGVRSTYMR